MALKWNGNGVKSGVEVGLKWGLNGVKIALPLAQSGHHQVELIEYVLKRGASGLTGCWGQYSAIQWHWG